MPRSHLFVKQSRKSHVRQFFAKVSFTGPTSWQLRGLHGNKGSTWLLQGLYGNKGSMWLLRCLHGNKGVNVVVTGSTWQ